MTWSQKEWAQNSSHNPKDYAKIFDVRGQQYHEAMLRFPHARDREFETILRYADLADGHVVCDYPSGGGYLERYITQQIDLTLLESSKIFLECASERPQTKKSLVENGIFPFADNSVDRVISLAGLHHIADKRDVFRQAHRCLKKGGLFTLADAKEGSHTARFLNEFVHAHSENGHEGIFLHHAIQKDLQSCGFNVKKLQEESYAWQFDSIADMCEYCKLMFGISRANYSQIEAAIRQYLGITENNNRVKMGWELLFIVAEK